MDKKPIECIERLFAKNIGLTELSVYCIFKLKDGDNMVEKIRDAYLKTNSIDDTVDITGINIYKVRRALITMGLWESKRSREVLALKNKGFTTEQIAEQLFLSVKGVESYLPYTRGVYLEKVTQDSADSKRYRERNKLASENQVSVQKNTKIEVSNRTGFSEQNVFKIKLTLDTKFAEMDTLKKYACVKNGITRKILVPASMQLYKLNHAIQRCFGWQNSHLHHFILNDKDFYSITSGSLEQWKRFAGVYFRCHYSTFDQKDDIFYLDNYDGSCSFRTWQKTMYTDNYIYCPLSEEKKNVRKNAASIQLRKNTFEDDIAKQFPHLIKQKTNLDDLKLTLVESNGEELLEKLEIKDILIFTDNFIYEYDYGDGWSVSIDKVEEYKCDNPNSYSNLDIKIRNKIRKVMTTMVPVCIEADGYNVFDDVGGIGGFCEFLKGIHGEENSRDYDKESIQWANWLGWKDRMPNPERIL